MNFKLFSIQFKVHLQQLLVGRRRLELVEHILGRLAGHKRQLVGHIELGQRQQPAGRTELEQQRQSVGHTEQGQQRPLVEHTELVQQRQQVGHTELEPGKNYSLVIKLCNYIF